MNKRLLPIIGAILLFAGVGTYFFIDHRANTTRINPDVIVADEAAGFSITEAAADSLVVDDISNIRIGSIIASGISDSTPNGALRKVLAIEEQDGGFRLSTRQAALTEAIDNCDVDFELVVGGDGSVETQVTDNLPETTAIGTILGTKVAHAIGLDIDEGWDKEFEIWDETTEVGFLEVASKGYVKIGGSIKISAELFGEKTADVEVWTRLFADLNGTSDEQKIAEIEDTIEFDLSLTPPFDKFEFFIGTVPIVLTNDIDAGFDYDMSVSVGKIEISGKIDKTIGFRYTSADGLAPVQKDESEPLKLLHGPLLKTETNLELFMTLGTYLYDFAGLEGRAGIRAELSTEMGVLDAREDESDLFNFADIIKRLGGKGDYIVWVPLRADFKFKHPDWDIFNIFDAGDASELPNFNLFSSERTEENTLYEEHISVNVGDIQKILEEAEKKPLDGSGSIMPIDNGEESETTASQDVQGGELPTEDGEYYEDEYIRFKIPTPFDYYLAEGSPQDQFGLRIAFWFFNASGSRSVTSAEITIIDGEASATAGGRFELVGQTPQGYNVYLYAPSAEAWPEYFNTLTIKGGSAPVAQESTQEAAPEERASYHYAGYAFEADLPENAQVSELGPIGNMGGDRYEIRDGSRVLRVMVLRLQGLYAEDFLRGAFPYNKLNGPDARGCMLYFAWDDAEGEALYNEVVGSMRVTLP